jgi:uncharacterized protein (DUF3820 family)
MKHVIHLTIESDKTSSVIRDGLVKLAKDAGAVIIAASYDTPRDLTDDSKMPFGKHKDTLMKDVPRDYLEWLVTQDWVPGKWPQIIDYVNGFEEEEDEIPF